MWLAECDRHRLEFSMEGRGLIDAKVIFDRLEPSWDRFIQGPRNLNNAVLHYCGRDQAAEFQRRDSGDDDDFRGVSLDEQNRHSAVKDADATLDVLLAQLERFDDLPFTVKGLHEWCEQVFAERSAAR